MSFTIDRVDHLVITCAEVDRSAAWYRDVLGMDVRQRDGRTSVHFGRQKINLRPRGAPGWFTAAVESPGVHDLCFVTSDPIETVITHWTARGVEIEVGPTQKVGALGPMTSVYCRDPDGNLIEVSNYGG